MKRAAHVVRAGAALALVAFAPQAAADLRATAARAEVAWRDGGADVLRAPPRFLYDDETLSLALPPAKAGRPCTSVALIGPPGMSFSAFFAAAPEDAPEAPAGLRTSSIAGIAEVASCEDKIVKDGRIVVVTAAGRGTLEVVIARSMAPLPDLRAVYPERTGGSLPAVPEPGALPLLPSPKRRAERAEARASEEGATLLPRLAWTIDSDGVGRGELDLDPGCHRFELFAAESRASAAVPRGGHHTRLDLDAELRDSDDDTVLARDRTEAPDARLEACVGSTTSASLIFAGAAPAETVIATHATWPLPEALPQLWGPGTRARMASALRAQRVEPKGAPVFLAQGASGGSVVPIAVEPGACYVAVAAMTHGAPRGLGLRAAVIGPESADERGKNDETGVVAFCAGRAAHARLEVEARGTSLAWGLAVYRVAERVWSTGR